MIISIIVAAAENGIIGKDNSLPWHLGADMKRFKNVTTGHTILMGKNTYLSIGRPLPNRRNVILSSSMTEAPEGFELIHSLDEIGKLGLAADEELMIIGGARVYAQALPMAKRLYLTEVKANVEGDTKFPEWDKKEWTETWREDHTADEKNDHDFAFVNYERK